MSLRHHWSPILVGLALALIPPAPAAEPLKVFILAGQSNMEGHAQVSTFDYIGEDPATAPLLKEMKGEDGKPRECERVWISYLTGDGVVKQGRLTAGYGALGGEAKIGPEFTFGLTMEKSIKGPVLILKTAWGGKSLHTDFRSPSAGPYELSRFQLENYPKQEGHGIPKDFAKWKADKVHETGHYYRLMIEHVRKVLENPQSVVPEYDAAAGYELAGFVWLQGWNDMCDSHTYPEGHQAGGYDLYATLLGHFIRDVRKDLKAPGMPFVIGVMGVGGILDAPHPFREAMAAPAALPEFRGNVEAVQTAPFWDSRLGKIDENRGKISQMEWMIRVKDKNGPNADGKMTEEQQAAYLKDYRAGLISPEDEALWQRGASNAGYHYLGCAKTFALMGRAFAEANLRLAAGQ
ncbi:MAG: sialate O-acetylesterase [Akkermansiaceae bacterium]|jgi:alpha-galactosidase|nr:sialate O-acetylesterase [Akkermansiaceae bacterium]